MTQATEVQPSAYDVALACLGCPDTPLRSEVCGPEHLAEIARAIAADSTLGPQRVGQPLLRRFNENGRILADTYRKLATSAQNDEAITTDAEWLLDNYYIIEDVIREVRVDLPRGYYVELPALGRGVLAGQPRIYALAVALIAHTDSSFDETQLLDFVRSYQAVTPLTIGELWAVPTMLRVALIENLSRLATQMLQARSDIVAAETLVARAHADVPVSAVALPESPRGTFLVALLHALRDHTPAGPAGEHLHGWLTHHGQSAAEVFRREHQRQATNQISIGNCVTSLRFLSVLDWNMFVEKTSVVEAVLRREPTGVYARQDFKTRDRYRHAIERLARGSRRAETDVAARAVARATAASGDVRKGHVGWHLIGEGEPSFAAELGYRPKFRDRCRAWLTRRPNTTYFVPILLITGGIIALAMYLAGVNSIWAGVALLFVLLLPASELAVGLTNHFVCWLLPPRVLPKLDFKDGIPGECATFVVIPSMLIRQESAKQLLDQLELHYLANPDPQLWFALLTDFADAPNENMPEDERYISAALEGVCRLNQRYAADGPDRFFVFHRRRQWNPVEGRWMGWERKRGKLQEFNGLLSNAKDTSFVFPSGESPRLPSVRYVLTLDADTVLPREAARQLVSTLAHPLNRAVRSIDGRRIVAGYGVLQPRVSFLYRVGLRSRFGRIFAGSAGIDPYSSASSDVYQDLFGRGSYTGKGLYDVGAFEETAGEAFPENHILSHDLIEANYARCALVTDIEFFDDFPARYHAYAGRAHRWVRGDWQLLPWLGRKVPVPNGPRLPNVLPLLERWKILDNLRRSVVPPALLLLLIAGWTLLPGAAWAWTLLAVLIFALPLTLQLLDGLWGSLRRGPTFAALRQARITLSATAVQAFLALVFLAHQSVVNCDAIVRTLYRLFVSRRHLLEWEAAAATEKRLGGEFMSFVVTMWPAWAITGLVALAVSLTNPSALPLAIPFLILWLLSPLVAFFVSQPLPSHEVKLTETEEDDLRRVARKTWGFFETFVVAEDNWLPPDNYQEEPKAAVAHRTSPTNVGLYLLSTLAAHDLGYLTLSGMIERLDHTLDTMERLERHQGHILNWYNTETLAPLEPRYVSTVDSGNLLGCLWALKHGLRDKLQEPFPSPSTAAGLIDTLALLRQELNALQETPGSETEPWKSIGASIEELKRTLHEAPADLLAWDHWLGVVEDGSTTLAGRIRDLAKMLAAKPVEVLRWAHQLVNHVGQLRAELDALAPWLSVLREESWPDGDSRWHTMRTELTSLAGVKSWDQRLPALIAELRRETGDRVAQRLADALEASAAARWADELAYLADQADAIARAMDFRFLYNHQRHLFSIGYNVSQERLDPAHYDLLASEACLASFLAIALGQVPRRNWFQLARLSTRVAGYQGLLSWGGTMFEYLMPRLLLSIETGTLLDTAQRAAVARQMEYGQETGVPWGISESGFCHLDATLDYQYQSFGVPGLGLKRGLNQDLVVAPYATMLAVTVAPREAIENFARLRAEGGEGRYGFYEAIDFTPRRMPQDRRSQVVLSYMAHHQGMSLVALASRFTDNAMRRRLHKEPMVRAADLLLQERVPVDATLTRPPEEKDGPRQVTFAAYPVSRRLTTPDTPSPRIHVLSNGEYTVLVTNSGASYSWCRGVDVTRWRPDRTADNWGQFCYVRDLRREKVWSLGFQPLRVRPQRYEVIFAIDKAEIRRLDDDIESLLEIAVSPDKKVEVRRVTLHNLDTRPRELELTNYAEVVLIPHAADLAHPAFGKLFLETEWLPKSNAILCRRRPRASDQKPVWGIHVIASDAYGQPTFETDRARFLGRRRTAADPVALDHGGGELSGTTGPVLDPVFCIRQRIRLAPGGRATVAFSTGVADTRDEAVALADQYHSLGAVARAFELAWAHSRVELRHLNLRVEDAHLYQRLAGYVLLPGPLRAPAQVLAANRQGQTALWRHGISGDLPIVLVRLDQVQELSFVRQVLEAHEYWAAKGIAVDLVVLCDDAGGYFEDLYQQVLTQVRASDERDLLEKPGGVFARKSSHMSDDDRTLLLTSARVVLAGDHGPLGAQIEVMERTGTPQSVQRWHTPPMPTVPPRAPTPELQFFNGLGGFTPDGTEYVIANAAIPPPAPWINVVANPTIGFLVSDSGSGYTWVGNSQTNRLTPWSNDPVSDSPGETLYLMDEITGALWSPTPLPIRDGFPVVARHGQGYSVFTQTRGELEQELTLFVPPEEPVKLWMLKLRNRGSVRRSLSASFYAELVLGTIREQTGHYVITEQDAQTGVLLARNSFSTDYPTAVAFLDLNLRPRTVTGDRTEFLGRNGTLSSPAALIRGDLSGTTGAGLDPCAAMQTKFKLDPGDEKTVVFVFGQAPDIDTVRRLAARYREPIEAEAALKASVARWNQILDAVQVQTPDAAMNILLNRWLLYQTISCRLWGRSAFYQSGGAYGFRDQLQDVMALVYAAPSDARDHLLRAARRQFLEGDVQHWWHPPAGRGVRTRFSDDFLWLPYSVSHYAAVTGDVGVLDEQVPFLRMPPLGPEQEEAYGQPHVTEETASLYEHCVRSLDNGWRLGAHGLPLMGTGDWNDGMNKVGAAGQGESVWNAWFQIACLKQFSEIATERGDTTRVESCRDRIEQLRTAAEEHAWDGSWYRRAYFDDGTPLGSAQNDECQIDSLAQSWAVISGAADAGRVRTAMQSAKERLVRTDDRVVLLLDPPFDQGTLEPGYIKGYVPGIRENGGQYTHAAIWLTQATALMGRGDEAYALWSLLNPIRHAVNRDSVGRYRVEPYVVAADVYGRPPHVGRGGWTWYTGSAAWLYRVALETLLGFQRRGNRLRIDPCIPSDWKQFTVAYRHGSSIYFIVVENPNAVQRGVRRVVLDNVVMEGVEITLVNDGSRHDVRIELGTR